MMGDKLARPGGREFQYLPGQEGALLATPTVVRMTMIALFLGARFFLLSLLQTPDLTLTNQTIPWTRPGLL